MRPTRLDVFSAACCLVNCKRDAKGRTMRGSLATTSAMILCLFLSISVSMKQQTIQKHESLRGLIPIVKKQLAPDREQTLLISNLSSELIELKELVLTPTSQPTPPTSPFDRNGPLSIASRSIIWLPLPVLGRSRCSAHAIINTFKNNHPL